MIGGNIIEVIKLSDKIWINTIDWEQSQDERTAIYVKRNPVSERVKPNDSIWWQGKWAMWAPKGKSAIDIKLQKIGNSGVPRPESEI